MRKIISVITVSILIFGCKNTEPIERLNEPAIYTVTEVDAEMNEAIKEAKKNLPKFYKDLESENPKYNSFGIKMTFPHENGDEHIWINSLFKKNNDYFGIVDNLPEFTRDVKRGDTVQIITNRVSDWMYLENSELKGGYTIRLLRNRMTNDEKIEFDKTSGMVIK